MVTMVTIVWSGMGRSEVEITVSPFPSAVHSALASPLEADVTAVWKSSAQSGFTRRAAAAKQVLRG